jgi:hypothetical protein
MQLSHTTAWTCVTLLRPIGPSPKLVSCVYVLVRGIYLRVCNSIISSIIKAARGVIHLKNMKRGSLGLRNRQE